MAVKIRLTRMGCKKRAFYRIVVMNSENRRDGRPLEYVGYYNPQINPAEVKIDMEKVNKWIGLGAEPSDTVRSLIKKANAAAA